jgi:hypothetical protein
MGSDLNRKKRLAFIVGIGRSGTTLLTKLLNNHPAIHCLPEANFMLFFLHRYGSKKKFTSDEIDKLFEEIDLFELSHPWVGWEFDKVDTRKKVDEYINSAGEKNYADLCRIVYENFNVSGVNKEDAEILMDKNPSYTLFMPELNAAADPTKFILITRDYRANILSRKQSVYLESPHVAYNAVRWVIFNKRALRFAAQQKNKVLCVRYEDLAAQPEKELKRICDFLNVDATIDLITENKPLAKASKRPAIPEKFRKRFEKKYSDIDKPVNVERINSWQTQLSPLEIEICDALCSDFAKKLGYEEFKGMSALKKAFIRLKQSPFILKAHFSVQKELQIYRISPELKLKRLRQVYEKLGFLSK